MGVKNFIMKRIPFCKMKAKRKYRESSMFLFIFFLYIHTVRIFVAEEARLLTADSRGTRCVFVRAYLENKNDNELSCVTRFFTQGHVFA